MFKVRITSNVSQVVQRLNSSMQTMNREIRATLAAAPAGSTADQLTARVTAVMRRHDVNPNAQAIRQHIQAQLDSNTAAGSLDGVDITDD